MSIDSSKYSDPSYFKISLQSPMIVAVAGGADAGKRDLCEVLMKNFSAAYAARVVVVSLTDFYRELTPEERGLYEAGKFNLDHPDVFDYQLLEDTLVSMKAGKPTAIPVWDHVHHTKKTTRVIDPVDVIMLEGTLLFYPKSLRDLMFMKIFIDVDSEKRLVRRVQKAKSRNGHTLSIKELLTEYVEFVKPMFDDYILPTKKFADLIIPRGIENQAALQVLSNHLDDHLKARSVSRKKRADDSEEPTADIRNTRKPSYRSTELLATSAASSYKQIPE
ncbi:uridine kinase family-domain-containing protein [Radiomyces spectabilis]|uniref:uridine kinase family-domain-containing protein n=1 Tax=Radiomyces spectabilis TaxID=64574 RepID=UPI00221EEDAD|nr:uridine kinase family-domain-containing protein [Radiomyces spectabilis]KAI8372936.1 uridine kinase family-domain-containing protein [Radiomyces spectabilis]